MKVLFCDNSLRELLNFRGKIINDYAEEGVEVVLVAPKTLENILLDDRIRYIPVELNHSGMNPCEDWRYFSGFAGNGWIFTARDEQTVLLITLCLCVYFM